MEKKILEKMLTMQVHSFMLYFYDTIEGKNQHILSLKRNFITQRNAKYDRGR